MVSGARWRAGAFLAMVTALASACSAAPEAGAERRAASDPTATASRPEPRSGEPSGQASAGRDQARTATAYTCADVRRLVTVTYRLRSGGSADQPISLDLVVDNRMDLGFAAETAGFVEVGDPAPGPFSVLTWGGSSADSIVVRPQAASTKAIDAYVDAGSAQHVGADARVTLVGLYTYVMPGGGRGPWCRLPAHMRATQCLAVQHPDGAWFLTVAEGMRIYQAGSKRLHQQQGW
jgi:hypothetical protein